MSWPEQPRSPIRVRLSDMYAFASDSIAVQLSLYHGPNDIMIGKIDEHGHIRWERQDTTNYADPGISFTIPNDFARELLDQLLRHYQGASDMHTVRADYLHERGRVDKLTDTISDIAKQAIENGS